MSVKSYLACTLRNDIGTEASARTCAAVRTSVKTKFLRAPLDVLLM